MANFAEDVWCGGVLRVAQEISAPFMSFVGPSPRFFATGTDPLVFSPFTGDPSALGRAGHTGSLVMRTDAPFGVWQKTGPFATDWTPIAGGGVVPGGVIVEDEGVPLGTFTTLNFTGAGVTATDAGGGVADVDVPGGAFAPTVEHLTTVANAATLDPTIDVSFVDGGGDADGRQILSLADGTEDGFEKTVTITPNVPVIGWRIVPAHGPTVNFADAPGGIIFRWNATSGAWLTIATLGGT